jgi:MoxR-like ATPase
LDWSEAMTTPYSGENQRTNGRPAAPRPLVAPEIRELEERIVEASRWIVPLKREIGTVIVGQHALVDRLLLGLLTNGHILLEGVPGLAKTLALKTLTGSIEGARFGRIQFTPDMLPSDIVGTTIYRAQTGTFEAKCGPVFANFVLADEINRAPAKVQSALLEAMQERQVTLGDETFALPEPFLVLATQNPLEQEGTYPLPEAQLDRFLMKVRVNYPDAFEERAILDSMAVTEPKTAVRPVVSLDTVVNTRRVVDGVYVSDAVRDYIVRIISATREPGRFKVPIEGLLRAGASPRGTIGLTLAARATAFLEGRGYVVPEDVKAVAPDVLRHRLALSFEAEATGVDGDEIVRRVLQTVVSP